MQTNQLSMSKISVASNNTTGLGEIYIPLWIYSGASASSSATLGGTSYLQKGSTSTTGPSVTVPNYLHTLSTYWSPNQKFALEVSMYCSMSGQTANAQIDTSGGLTVSGSNVAITSTSPIVVRSGAFTLTGGQTYVVSLFVQSSGSAYLTKAHLVALLN